MERALSDARAAATVPTLSAERRGTRCLTTQTSATTPRCASPAGTPPPPPRLRRRLLRPPRLRRRLLRPPRLRRRLLRPLRLRRRLLHRCPARGRNRPVRRAGRRRARRVWFRPLGHDRRGVRCRGADPAGRRGPTGDPSPPGTAVTSRLRPTPAQTPATGAPGTGPAPGPAPTPAPASPAEAPPPLLGRPGPASRLPARRPHRRAGYLPHQVLPDRRTPHRHRRLPSKRRPSRRPQPPPSAARGGAASASAALAATT